MTEKEIARIAYMVTREYAKLMGDKIGPEWGHVSQAVKDNVLEGVQYHIATPVLGPSESPGRHYVFRAVVLALTSEDSQ